MYKLCKTEQSAARQRILEEGLLTAISVRRYDELSVSDLCTQLGIPRKSFYRYFSSKEGALHALLDHTLMGFDEFSLSTATGQRTLHRDLSQFFLFWQHHKPLLDALEKNDLSGLLIQRAIAYGVSGAALPRRFLPKDTLEMQEQVTMFAVCGLMSMVIAWHQSGFAQPVSKMADTAIRVLSQPLFPDTAALF